MTPMRFWDEISCDDIVRVLNFIHTVEEGNTPVEDFDDELAPADIAGITLIKHIRDTRTNYRELIQRGIPPDIVQEAVAIVILVTYEEFLWKPEDRPSYSVSRNGQAEIKWQNPRAEEIAKALELSIRRGTHALILSAKDDFDFLHHEQIEYLAGARRWKWRNRKE
jgi:hypothetical protein